MKSGISLVFLGLVFFTTTSAWAKPYCAPDMESEQECWVMISDLHPTQFAVGMYSVEEKEKKLNDKSWGDYKDYLKGHPVPVVVGPDRRYYLTDHHHLARAVLEIGGTEMLATIEANYSDLGFKEFWTKMNSKHWLYLLDEKGLGPKDPDSLPKKISQLKDDPYRSLAYFVREAGGYEKSDEFFAEFKWAEFFRSRVQIGAGRKAFDTAVDQAVKLAHSPAAKGLPGYTSR